MTTISAAAARLFVLALALFGSWQAHAQTPAADGWVTLGRYTVPAGATSARFAVRPGIGRFNATRLVLVSGRLELARVVVTYANGATHYEDREVSLVAGDRMARMDEREELRAVEFIDIYLKPGSPAATASVVEIGGIINPQPAPVVGAASSGGSKKSAKKSAPPGSGQAEERARAEARRSDDERSRQSSAAREREAAAVRRPPAPIVAAPMPSPPPPPAPGASASRNDGLGLGGTGTGGGGSGSGGIAASRSVVGGGPPRSIAPAPAPAMAPPPPPVAAASEPVASGAPATTSAGDERYTPVPVFFGTDRKREADRTKWDRKLAAFSGVAAPNMTLGRAVVSVPKQGREKGEISRPEWDLFFTSVSLRSEDLSRDFVLLNVDVYDRNTFLAEVRKHAAGARTFRDQAFVFVHGYRVSFDDALFRAAQITHDMGFDGLPFLYSWPSSAGVAGYVYDERRALGAREPLRAFLDMVVKESGAKKVHLIAHSMGAHALLEVLRDIRNIAGGETVAKPIFNEIILAAPDVNRENFEQISQRVRGLATGMTLYASANDNALRLSQKLSGASAGFVSDSGPVLVNGVDSIDVSAASTDFFTLNHSTFADRAQLIEDMRLLLEKSVRPPDQRVQSYAPVSGAAGTYWKYVPR